MTWKRKKMERREFIKKISLLGGLALVSRYLPACRPVKEETAMTKVSLVKTADRVEGTRQAIKLLKINPVKGKAVVLKPNFNTADPAPGSTHIDTLRTLITTLKEMGAKKITLAERSGPGDTSRNIMEKKGVLRLATELGFDIVNLQEMPKSDWVLFRPPDSHWKDGFLFPRVCREAESIVQTCCLKTHQFGGHFTLSLKCSVGMLPPGLGPAGGEYSYMNELHSSRFQRQMIAEINTAYSPDLIVMDGVEAFVDGGPHMGTRVKAEVMLGSSDRVAIDAVGVAILRLLGTTPDVSRGKIFEQDQIKRAAELGLGVKSADQIELITGDKDSAEYAKKVKEMLGKG
ncbi:MAG: hypothetical protein A2Z29_01280 [Chloroflexi bacterium RBG_16_56_11]|nr:MAG: hypothetical protein A2Z29_01280 [Chloroflexi bacterium RBG_16_56_11]